MPTAHPSGWAHADGALRGPHWLREPTDLHRARLVLVQATRTVFENGLDLVGVSAPERM